MASIVISIIVGIIIFVGKIRTYIEIKNNLSNKSKTLNHMNTLDFSLKYKIIFSLLVLFGISSAIYGYFTRNDLTVSLGIIIFFIFTSELILSSINYKLYYNSESIIIKGSTIRYKSIKKISSSKFPLIFPKIVTYNGQKYPVPQSVISSINKYHKI